jgi:hypothetical protein
LSNIEQAATADFDELQHSKAPASRPGRAVPTIGKRGLQLLSWLMPIVVVAIWELLAQAGWLSPQVLPAPTKVVKTAVKLATSGSLSSDLGVSLLRAIVGFVIGGSVGFTLGVLVGFSRIAEAAIDRSVQMIRAIPFLAVLPLVIVWKAHDIFLEGRDLEFQIDYTSYLTTRKFATDNPALVRAVNDAFRAEGKWISENSKEAEYIAQRAGKYGDQVRDQFIAMNRQYRYFAVNDEQFLGELQRAADWLVARKVLPEPVKVTDHLAQL